MSRKIRIHYYGAIYHVMVRGNFKCAIFYDENDYLFFYKLLSKAVNQYMCRIHLFCLMTNHIHLVVEVQHIPLNKIMHSICSQYSNYFNKKNNRTGHLFQGRYKAIEVTSNEYLLELCHYIHKNPVSANMVQDFNNYRWSSHSVYVGTASLKWLTTDKLLHIINDRINTDIHKYSEFMSNTDKYISTLKFCNLDENGFLIISNNKSNTIKKNRSLDFKAIPLKDVINSVCEYFRLDLDEIVSKKRSNIITHARNSITYFAHYRCQYYLRDIALFLKRNPNTISSSLNVWLSKANKDPTIHSLIESIERYIYLSVQETKINN